MQARVIVDENGCWIWQLKQNNNGYGVCMWQGKTQSAHRLALFAVNGVWPELACHIDICPSRACCNPDHLYNGTKQSNGADRKRKGTKSVITAAAIDLQKVGLAGRTAIPKLKAMGWTSKAIAELFEITYQEVYRVLRKLKA